MSSGRRIGFDGLTFDAGALIAIENRSPLIRRHLENATRQNMVCVIPAGALAQVWRGRVGGRHVHLDRTLRLSNVRVHSLDATSAKLAGELCGLTGTNDIVDASVALCARSFRHAVVTSDPDDIRRLDRSLPILRV